MRTLLVRHSRRGWRFFLPAWLPIKVSRSITMSEHIESLLRLRQIIGDRKSSPPIPPLIPVSKSTWWAGVASGRFPAPVKIGREGRATFWRESDLKVLTGGGLAAASSREGWSMKRQSLRTAIDQNCKQCIYDKACPGTWRQQVSLCTVIKCPIWDVRAMPTSASLHV